MSGATYHLICAHCHVIVERELEDAERVLYCSAACQRRASKQRNKNRRRRSGVSKPPLRSDTDCPRPDKKRYDTEAEAEAVRLWWFPRHPGVHSYLCQCGSWHVGNKTKAHS